MKVYLHLILLFISSQVFSQTGFEDLNDHEEIVEANLKWYTDLEVAKLEAENTNKPILLFFTGSDWCSPCKMLKEDFFNTQKFEEKSKHIILVMVDMPRRLDIITPEQKEKNKLLVNVYNTSKSYPNLVALTKNLTKIDELSGYTLLRETETHFQFINSLITNYSHSKKH